VTDSRTRDWRKRFRVAFAVRAGSFLVRLLGFTWRFTHERREGFARLRAAREPMILILWHGELLPCLWCFRNQGIIVLISTHSDGEIIARIAESFGYGIVRGSTSRGGARAMLELSEALGSGHEVAITPDGPRGPRHVFAPGALALAQRSGAYVVCGRLHATRAWRLRSWDRFLIPKPFARITVTYSDPQRVQTLTPRDAEAEAPAFERLMESLGSEESLGP
jgi:lysophospholipid acyltransferase (LPLAT)-like uncharacterized protein